jgi:putative transposase
MQAYADYYHRTRTHLALQKDCPEPREMQPPDAGPIVSIPEVGGLHHRYQRRAT